MFTLSKLFEISILNTETICRLRLFSFYFCASLLKSKNRQKTDLHNLSPYSSTVEHDTVNIGIEVRFLLGAMTNTY